MNEQKVFREQLKEHRGDYYVLYTPADTHTRLACVGLAFLEEDIDSSVVKQAMEKELNIWLARYPVPVMVTAFNIKDDVISIDGNGSSHLMGYLNSNTGEINSSWDLYRDSEMPSDQITEEYLKNVYQDIPYKLQEDVRREVMRKAKIQGRAIRTIIVFIATVPVLIELIAYGVGWIGHIMAIGSILIGLYKLAQAMGWIKRGKRELEKAELERKKDHYYYHCERNPEGFNRLKVENFEKDIIEQTIKESEEIRNNGVSNLPSHIKESF